jgi:aminopeptidase N
MTGRRLLLAVAVAVFALAAAAPAVAGPYVAGSAGAGDPFFPLAGNGGYDVGHYALAVTYDPTTKRLAGRAVIFATATENLRGFDLDLRDFLRVSQVTVNGQPARFAQRDDQELVIRPRMRVRAGRPFVVAVAYAGEAQAVVDPDESLDGWIPTEDGAFVANEPQGSPSWFPVNDTLRDKASYDVRVTVPAGRTVMGNGVLVGREDHGTTTTWHWLQRAPMASYLATATNGTFATRFRRLASGLPVYDAVDPQTREDEDDLPDPGLAFERLSAEPEIVRFFSALYGDYPFESVGGIVDWAPEVGYALESQTKPNYDRTPDPGTVVHELSHQWFGDAVTPLTWADIWLNEGFATFSQWIYDERHGGPSAQAAFDELYATPDDTEEGQDLWFPAPAALPDASYLFSTPVYDRGAMTLQALRARLGDRVFFEILQTWYRQHRYGNASTADFIALAQRRSGRDLSAFFRTWLYTPGRPASL